MTWEHMHIAAVLARANPPSILVSSNPILAGVGSVFNLASVMDEPIAGLIQPGLTYTDDAIEDQAEGILGQAEQIIQASETSLGQEKTQGTQTQVTQILKSLTLT